MVPFDQLNEVVNQYFAKAYKFKMQGKDAESKDMTTRALRLQGSLTKTKPIQPPIKHESTLPPRTDVFKRAVLRREGNVGPDDGVLAVPDQQVDRGHRLANAHVLSHHVQRQNSVRPTHIKI